VEDPANHAEVAALLAAPNRIGTAADVLLRTYTGRLKVSPDGLVRENADYLLVGRKGAARPDPVQAAWLYAQMVRWGQAPLTAELLAAAQAVFRPDLYDAASDVPEAPFAGPPADRIGAFAGPSFDADAIEDHLAAWSIKRERLL
jgi:NitT/TauT family transport system ATP-binding protein